MIERELKFVAESAAPPGLPAGWSLGDPSHRLLRDTYLDCDGLLAAAGLALRRRAEQGAPNRYTLKSRLGARAVGRPAPALVERREIEAEAAPDGALPEAVATAIDSAVALPDDRPNRGLETTLSFEQRRTEWPLLEHGARVATLSVDEVSVPSAGAATATWIEVEIEFLAERDGDRARASSTAAAADALATAILAQPGYAVSDRSKEQRARIAVTEASA